MDISYHVLIRMRYHHQGVTPLLGDPILEARSLCLTYAFHRREYVVNWVGTGSDSNVVANLTDVQWSLAIHALLVWMFYFSRCSHGASALACHFSCTTGILHRHVYFEQEGFHVRSYVLIRARSSAQVHMVLEVLGKTVEQSVGSRFRWHYVIQSLSGD